MFWTGIVFSILFCIFICNWALLVCSTENGIGSCKCGFDFSGKTVFHSSFITSAIILFFIGGLVTGSAYLNNREQQFIVGVVFLCISGCIWVVWLISLGNNLKFKLYRYVCKILKLIRYHSIIR